MKFVIKDEMKGRLRVHFKQKYMSCEQADTIVYYFQNEANVTYVKVYERTADVVIKYIGERENIITQLRHFAYEDVTVPEEILENSGRQLNAKYQEQLVLKVMFRYMGKCFLPIPIRNCYTAIRSVKYMCEGAKTLAKGKLEVPVLDATAIGVSLVRNDFKTASSIMFLLGIGETLEEWTHKKSVDDLARMLSLNINKVWIEENGERKLVQTDDVRENDLVIVHMGNVIPFDGVVTDGEAIINQSSFTGESQGVRKSENDYVYAGTVVEEGNLIIKVSKAGKASRFDKIVTMIEETEKLKSSVESRAEHLADRLVPYTLAGTAVTYLLTRNVSKALSVLMVDYSCALKLAMPITVLSAIREASFYNITIKGGKYLEAVAEADTIVFDKTGTLTKATPKVAQVVSFCEKSPEELLRIAACMEEHFPHSIANAVVDEAKKRGLEHSEMHTKVEYVVAHGISTTINGERAIIGSHHFVFEDEGCVVPSDKIDMFESLPQQFSHLYLAMENRLAAVICIEDPLREEAFEVIKTLKNEGIKKIVMMTGDNERTAKVIAQAIGVDEYYAGVLPEDKAAFIEKEKAKGCKVIMIGDGINDSPALSAADVGIAISDGAEIAREIADITIGADDLHQIVTLKRLSDKLMKKINKNYKEIVVVNSGLILCGIAGVIQPATSALLHNTSTLTISLRGMQNLLT